MAPFRRHSQWRQFGDRDRAPEPSKHKPSLAGVSTVAVPISLLSAPKAACGSRQRAGDDDPVIAGEHPGEALAVTLRQRLPQPPLLLPASPAAILACLVPASPA